MRHFRDGQTVVIEPWRARAFPVVKDLVVDRSAFDRIVQAGGYVSVNTGQAPEANSIPVPKEDAEEAMDAAACIGCGACVAACPNASAMLFVAAKVSHLEKLPHGRVERKRRVLKMVDAMDQAGFGNCTNHYECMQACPKSIHVKFIAKMNRQYLRAKLTRDRAGGTTPTAWSATGVPGAARCRPHQPLVSRSNPEWGRLAPYRRALLPAFPGWAAALGPGVVWMALAQGSSELIWWPYLIAKYGLAFLFLLIPACLLQFPVNYAIGSYTLLTGETIFQGFIRVNRWAALALWIAMTVSFLWFGAFASAGGTALAALTHFPAGWDARGQTLFWGYASIIGGYLILMSSRVIYAAVERIMWVVALVTVAGLVAACSHSTVLAALPSLLRGLAEPQPLPRPWDPADATKLLTAITFAGLGGFWTLFYSYWLREKGAGMAKTMGHVEGLAGRHEVTFETGVLPERVSVTQLAKWRQFLAVDSAVGIVGNILTTLMTCLLAYAVLHPQGVLPDKYEIAVVQARFFEVSWGAAGRTLFLVVAAAFLADTWMATADAVARIHTDCLLSFFPAARRWSVKRWYLVLLTAGAAVTAATMPLSEPGPLILLSALIGFIGTVSFAAMLHRLNHGILPQHLHRHHVPQRWARLGLVVAGVIYAALAVAYLVMLSL
jgi:ferredoxin